MLEFANAGKFIKDFEFIYSKKIIRIPYTTKEGERKTLLMCKCGRTFISLPYLSVGVMEKSITDRKTAPFMLFETEEGNIISTSKQLWEIRDTLAHSHYIYSDKLYTRLSLADSDNVVQLYTSDVRRKIRKAAKDGIVVKYGKSKVLIKAFYKVYVHRMHEINVAPASKKIITKGVKRGVTTVFVAYKDNIPVGGATLSDYNGEIYANGLMASLSQYNKHYVSYALHNAMITFSKENNAQYYSFGRSTRNSSVHQYKKHFRGEEIPLYWSYSYRKKNIRDRKLLYKIWGMLPFFVTKHLGQIISKYVY